MNVLAQVIGLIAMACVLWSFQQNKRALILVYFVIGQLIFSVHFGLLQAWTAVVVSLIAIVRGIIFYHKHELAWARWWFWPYLFVGIIWLAGTLVWEGPRSLLILVAITIETVGVWRDSPRQIRYFLLSTRPLFFVYAFLSGSYAGMLADLLFSISLITGMIRFDRNRKTISK